LADATSYTSNITPIFSTLITDLLPIASVSL